MESPFPGVDPFIEASGPWNDFHHEFLAQSTHRLNERLPDDYVSRCNWRYIQVDGGEFRERWLEILKLPEQRIVTIVEHLCPHQKDDPGRRSWLDLREARRASGVNLVAIDLLLGGHRLPLNEPPAGDLCAIVTRAASDAQQEVHAWSIRLPLPTIPIPLADGDPDFPLELAGISPIAYKRGRYWMTLRYDLPLTLPLSPDDRAWAEALVRSPRP